MSDDEEERLFIDDHDVSGGPQSTIGTDIFASYQGTEEKKTQESLDKDSLKKFPINNLSHPFSNSMNGGLEAKIAQLKEGHKIKEDVSREEGEIEESADTSSAPKNKIRFGGSVFSPESELSVDTSIKIEKIGPHSSNYKSMKMSPISAKISPGKVRKGVYEDHKLTNGNNIGLMCPKQCSKNTSQIVGRKRRESGGEEEKIEKKRPNTQKIHDQRTNPPKKHKTLNREKGTSVHTVAIQCERDESIFDMEDGTNAMANFTILKKIENSVYVCFRWKDQELYGILTDGQSPTFPNISKKRPVLNGASDTDRAAGGGTSTPSKSARDPKRRGGSVVGDKKKSISTGRAGSSGEGNEKDDEDCDPSDGSSRTGELMLVESSSRRCSHLCSFDGCEFRFDRATELEYHKATSHAKKRIMFDTRCSQTDSCGTCNRETSTEKDIATTTESVHVQTDAPFPSTFSKNDSLKLTDQERDSIKKMMNCGRRDTAETIPCSEEKNDSGRINTPNEFSDISDNEEQSAPQLQKEEPSPRSLSSLSIHSRPPGAIGQSAFTPTESNTHKIHDEKGVSDRKDRSASLPMVNNTPQPQNNSFQPVNTDGKPRALSNSQQPQTMNGASPRPTNLPAAPFMSSVPGIPAPAPGFPFMIPPGQVSQFTSPMGRNAVASPARQNESQQHKIHELKAKEQGSSSGATCSDASASSSMNASPAPKVSISAGPPASNPSPARPAQFMQMMGQPGAHQQMQMMAAQAQQQQQQHNFMQAAMMMQAFQGRPGMPPGFPMANPTNPQEAYAAQQLATMFGAVGAPSHMFQK